jgi:hypothetical protein
LCCFGHLSGELAGAGEVKFGAVLVNVQIPRACSGGSGAVISCNVTGVGWVFGLVSRRFATMIPWDMIYD